MHTRRLFLAALISVSVAGCNVLLGLDDFYPACEEPGCRTCADVVACKKMLGEPCIGNTDCASIKCADPDADGKMTCLKNSGDPCTQNFECWNNLCKNGFCSP